MHILEKLMQKTPSNKAVTFWNMMGSLVSAATSVLLLMLVTRTLGDEKAGIFSLGFSVSMMMLTVGVFEVRAFQSTDIYKQFSISDYFTFRILTCAVMMISALGYVWLKGYADEKAWVVFLLCLLKCAEAFCDVFNGQAQQNDRLDVAGFSTAMRVFLYCIGFFVSLLLTRSLLFSCGVMVLITVLWLLLFDVRAGKHFEKCGLRFDKAVLFSLFKSCLPLFFSAFLMSYINNAPKFSVDTYLSAEYQAYYGIIFMPASVINMFSLFAFRPLLTKLTAFWNENKRKEFLLTITKLVLWILFVTVAALAGGWLLGVPLLSWFYGTDLTAYKSELMVVLLGGGFNALDVFLYYMITVMRKQKYVLLGYGFATVTAWILGDRLVSAYGLMGASETYLISEAVVFAVFAVIFTVVLLTKRKKEAAGI